MKKEAEAEAGPLRLQARRCQGLLAATESWDRHGVKSPTALTEGANAPGTSISDFQPPEPRENKRVSSHPVGGDLLRPPQETNTPRGCLVLPTRPLQTSFVPTVLGVFWAHGPRLGRLCDVFRFALCSPVLQQLGGTGGTSVTNLILQREEQRLGLRSGFLQNVGEGEMRGDSQSPAGPASQQARELAFTSFPLPVFLVGPLAILWSPLYDKGCDPLPPPSPSPSAARS